MIFFLSTQKKYLESSGTNSFSLKYVKNYVERCELLLITTLNNENQLIKTKLTAKQT